MAKAPKRRSNPPIKLTVDTAEGKLCLVLPLEVVISLAIDRIKIGAAQEDSETNELEILFGLDSQG